MNMRRRHVDGNSFAFLCDDIDELEHSVQESLPRVSVIMPLKGFGEHNLQNWRTQVRSDCKICIMFVVYIFNCDAPLQSINSTDYITLWRATRIPLRSREQRRSSLSCCFPFDLRVQGRWIT